MPFPKAIITKPFLVSNDEYKDLGLNINLVGYDSFSQVAENTKQHASPRHFSIPKSTLIFKLGTESI